MGKAIAILADILQSSNLDNSAIERERQVILREMQEVGTCACLLSQWNPMAGKVQLRRRSIYLKDCSSQLCWAAQAWRQGCMPPEACWLRAYRGLRCNSAGNITDHSAGGYASGSRQVASASARRLGQRHQLPTKCAPGGPPWPPARSGHPAQPLEAHHGCGCC